MFTFFRSFAVSGLAVRQSSHHLKILQNMLLMYMLDLSLMRFIDVVGRIALGMEKDLLNGT